MSEDGNMKRLTLTLVHADGRILLGMKKRGFGMGKWNGFGGKVEPGESVEDAARRELFEEAGIRATTLDARGRLHFHFEDDPTRLEIHVFFASTFDGRPEESEEMRPQWFDEGEIPFHVMWPDDRHWLPHVLEGKSVDGRFWYKGEEIVKYRLEASL